MASLPSGTSNPLLVRAVVVDRHLLALAPYLDLDLDLPLALVLVLDHDDSTQLIPYGIYICTACAATPHAHFVFRSYYHFSLN